MKVGVSLLRVLAALGGMIGFGMAVALAFVVAVYSFNNAGILAVVAVVIGLCLAGIIGARRIGDRTRELSRRTVLWTAGLELAFGLASWLVFGPAGLYLLVPLLAGGVLTLLLYPVIA